MAEYCVRCGWELGGRQQPAPGRARGAFAAAPHESHLVPRIVSTLFPQLPRASLLSFRWTLALGTGVVAALGAARLLGLAVIAAAVLVPLLTVVYLYAVDVYEDEPLHVVGLTMLWGAVAGVGVGLLANALAPPVVEQLTESTQRRVLAQGVLIPAVATVLMLAGPLILLPYRKFNDVLDGATFGAATAVAFVGAMVITDSIPLLGAGVRPVALVSHWIFRLLALAIAMPLLAAGAIGGAAGAFWLRYRAPVTNRNVLGVLGRPPVAVAIALVLLVAGALAPLLVRPALALLWLVALDAVALVWLRRVIHLGLLEESAEIEIGPAIRCANCGRETPRHTFCARCGISLHALPKSRQEPRRPLVEPGPKGAA